MNEYLLRCLLGEPFQSFVIRLEGGYEIVVTHPEAVSIEPRLEYVIAYDKMGYAEVFQTDRIVTLRRAGGKF